MPFGSGVLKCRKCGQTKEGKMKQTKSETAHDKKEVVVLEKEESSLPTIERECAKCGNALAFFWLIQTRASDEPPTRFFRCTKCKNTWREYS